MDPAAQLGGMGAEKHELCGGLWWPSFYDLFFQRWWGGWGPRNMKSIRPPLVAILFFSAVGGGGWPLSPPNLLLRKR